MIVRKNCVPDLCKTCLKTGEYVDILHKFNYSLLTQFERLSKLFKYKGFLGISKIFVPDWM